MKRRVMSMVMRAPQQQVTHARLETHDGTSTLGEKVIPRVPTIPRLSWLTFCDFLLHPRRDTRRDRAACALLRHTTTDTRRPATRRPEYIPCTPAAKNQRTMIRSTPLSFHPRSVAAWAPKS